MHKFFELRHNILTKLTKNLSWLELSPIAYFIAEIFTFAEKFKKSNVNNNGKGNDIDNGNGNANINGNLNDNVNDDVFAVSNFSGFSDFFLQCKEEKQ